MTPGVALLEAGDHARQVGRRQERRGRDGDPATPARHQILRIGHDLFDVAEDALRTSQQFATGLGDRDLPRGAVHELQAQLRFELPDQEARRRLGQVQLAARRGKAARTHDLDECAELPQGDVHAAAV